MINAKGDIEKQADLIVFPYSTFKGCHCSAARNSVIQLSKLKKTAFMKTCEGVNWNKSMFSEGTIDITDNLDQLKDVVLKQGRNVKFKSLLKRKWSY